MDKRALVGTVVVVDNDASSLRVTRELLVANGFATLTASSGAEAFELLEQPGREVDCVLTDLYMQGVSGMDLLMHAKQALPELPIIVLTARADVPSAVAAIRAGAFDYLVKPLNATELSAAVARAVENRRLRARNRFLERRVDVAERFRGMIGNCPPMRQVFELVANVAQTDATVLIGGESGTGKELVARALHEQGPRASRPFVAINCGALTETLLESELFGHEKGAFTGADSRRRGLFEEASGGTIFLDEVGELTLATQVRLLRVLQERHVRPVGSNQARPIDVRVVAATNRDLTEEVRERRFREDLFYRLNVVSIELPPLRTRGEDIVLLAQHLLVKHAARMAKAVTGFAPETLELLRAYDFPGNVRELENCIERALIMTPGSTIERAALPAAFRTHSARPASSSSIELSFNEARSRFERQYIERVLEASEFNLSHAARRAGMDRSNFRRLLERYDLRIFPTATRASA